MTQEIGRCGINGTYGKAWAIYLSKTEINALLDGVEMPTMQCLALCPCNWTAMDLPHEVIVKHALPHIVLDFIEHDLSTEGRAFDLVTWHMGRPIRPHQCEAIAVEPQLGGFSHTRTADVDPATGRYD